MRLLVDRLWDWKERDDTAVFFEPHRGPTVELTGRALIERASVVASHLQPSEPVLILCPPGPDFVVAMVGALLAGAVAVPAYPPASGNRVRALARLRSILADIRPTLLLRTTAQAEALATVQGLPSAIEIDLLPASGRFSRRDVPGDSVSLLQYTSGSTSAPRGVRLTHANLTINVDHLAARTEHDGVPQVICSWVPPYHDMGLIGGILYPLQTGGPTVLLPPRSVLREPRRWFEAIGRHRATVTSAPPFALDRCIAMTAADPSLDLSSLRSLFVASEPVPARTLSSFTRTFAPCGLEPTAVRTAYGLAESTVFVASSLQGRVPRVHDGIVSCGDPIDELRIVDASGVCVPEGEHGEIWLRGSSVADGYENHPGGPFGHQLAGHGGGWLRTGDLGCLHQGELFVHGRVKDVITQRGRQHHAHDLEHTVGLACAEIQERQVVAFADLRPGDSERAVVLVELDHPTERHRSMVRRALSEGHELSVHELVFVEPGSIRWTTSRKKARGATRAAWQRGDLTIRPITAVLEPPPSTNALYPHLAQHADALDARKLAYRYDLERDLPWDRGDEPGIHMTDELIAFMYSELRPLLDDPDRRDFVQWALGLATCEVIAWLETSVVAFVHRQAPTIEGERPSLVAMVEEEHKHMAMFQRYADQLRARRPESVPAYEAALAEAISRVPAPSLEGDQPAEWHFAAWVRLLIFEEWSVWLHARLKGRTGVQPLWAALHKMHAREEIQHVRTDAAWLDGLELDAATRGRLIRGLPLDVMRRVQLVNHTVRTLCEQRWPDVRLPQPDPARPLVALLRDPAFRYTRAIAPELVELVERGLPQTDEPTRVSRVPSPDEALSWLRSWASRRRPETTFEPDASFAELGMDSVDRLDLSAELDQWLGGELPSTLTYELPTPRLLAEHLASLLPHAPTTPTDIDAVDNAPASLRQQRWLDGVPDEGRCHNVVGAWVAPRGTRPEALAAALVALVDAHPGLRRSFERRTDGWWQVRNRDAAVISTEACADDLVEALQQQIRGLSERPWHPERDPTFIGRVLATEERCGVVWSAPHVVADGGARLVLVDSLDAALRGLPLESPDPAVLALQERAQASSPAVEARLRWWRSELDDLPATPAPRPRFAGSAVRRTIDAARARAWLAGRTETAFVHLLTSYARAWQTTRGREAVIGTQLADRTTSERRATFGYLNDVVVVRPRLRASQAWTEACASVGRAWEQGVQRRVVVDDIVRHAFPERWRQRWLPAPVSFNYLPALDGSSVPAGWTRVTAPVQQRSFLFYEEMLVAAAQPDGSLVLTCWYDRETVGRDAAVTTLDAFEHVLDGLASTSSRDGRDRVGSRAEASP